MAEAGSLKTRLAYLRASRKTPTGPTYNQKTGEHPALPEGWERVGEHLWRRKVCTRICPLPDIPFRLPFPSVDRAALRFFDLETTGLSGGAGTIAFLAGVGMIEEGTLTVHQLFISDFPGEGDFLRVLLSLLPTDAVLVSYNGKSFDSHLLRTRCLMNSLSCFLPEVHIDLLYPSRRLFKSLTGGCSLGDLEERILDIHRDDDIPGRLIPEVYFSYLRTGNLSLIDRVFYHNLQDILSLEVLLGYIMTRLEDPFHAGPVDPSGLGRLLFLSDHPAAEEYLLDAFERGDVSSGRILALYLKRLHRYEEADRIWKILSENYRDTDAAVERAKHLEHRLKDPIRALAVLKDAVTPEGKVPRNPDDALQHRMKRLETKIADSGGSSRGTL